MVLLIMFNKSEITFKYKEVEHILTKENIDEVFKEILTKVSVGYQNKHSEI